MEKVENTKSPNIALEQILSKIVVKRLKETGIDEQLIIALLNEHADANELLRAVFGKAN